MPLGLRESLSLFGTDYDTPDGTCIRDYIHIQDLGSAHVMALDALDERDVMVYNLGTGQGHSNREVIEVAREVTGHEIPVVARQLQALGQPPLCLLVQPGKGRPDLLEDALEPCSGLLQCFV